MEGLMEPTCLEQTVGYSDGSPLEPTTWRRATLVDVLDRLLDKGLVLRTDIIISMAGIPLIGVNLTAAIAGIETMLQYGMMNEWDEQTRTQVRQEIAAKPSSPLAAGEKLERKCLATARD